MARKRTKRKVVAYLRVSSADKQDVGSQKLAVMEYAQRNGIKIDKIIETEMSSRRSKKLRKLDELFGETTAGDLIIVAELSRLGRSLVEITKWIHKYFLDKDTSKKDYDGGRHLICIRENIIITNEPMSATDEAVLNLFATLARLESQLMSERITNGIDFRMNKKKLHHGRKKGEKQYIALDDDKERILELLELGLSPRQSALGHLKVEPQRLYYWMKSRGIRKAGKPE
jgi:DNA invertase Pin-like site-specific DNA recombinase